MRGLTIVFMLLLTTLLASCSKEGELPRLLNKEGIAPYEYSESDKFVLKSLGLKNKANIINFNAPKTAKSLQVNVYELNKEKAWDITGGIVLHYDEQVSESKRFKGTFSMLIKDNYAIDYYLDSGSFQSQPLIDEDKMVASTIGYLQEFQKIELNKEIPVAMIVLNKDSSMRTHSLEDYFNPTVFDDNYIVRFVTLKFTDVSS